MSLPKCNYDLNAKCNRKYHGGKCGEWCYNHPKPPIGLKPKFVKKLERRQEILDAISRYVEANMPIPIEWVEEYNELVKE